MKKNFSKNQLSKLIRQTLRENLMKFDVGYKLHNLELSEYTRIQSNLTGINACIFIDECSSFKRWQHPLWVIISKGDPYHDSWITMSINQESKVITENNVSESNTFLSADIINECKQFISKFYPVLIRIALEKVDSSLIYDILENNDWHNLSKEDIRHLYNTLNKDYILDERQSSVK